VLKPILADYRRRWEGLKPFMPTLDLVLTEIKSGKRHVSQEAKNLLASINQGVRILKDEINQAEEQLSAIYAELNKSAGMSQEEVDLYIKRHIHGDRLLLVKF
jgi:fructose-1,6-bisphosphatase